VFCSFIQAYNFLIVNFSFQFRIESFFGLLHNAKGEQLAKKYSRI
jgi:hypothetical protein